MFSIVTGPASEIFSSSDVELRRHCSLDDGETEWNALIDTYVRAARARVEGHCRIALLPQTWRLTLMQWPQRRIAIPAGPVRSVEAVRYTASDGTLTDMDAADFRLLKTGPLASVSPAFGQAWPSSACDGSIEIDIGLGHDDAAAVPEDIKQAVRMLTAHFFRFREATEMANVTELPFGVSDLLASHRVFA